MKRSHDTEVDGSFTDKHKRQFCERDKEKMMNTNFKQNDGVISCMSTHPRSAFDKQFPYFRKPCEIGCLSLGSKGEFYNDRCQMKYYVRPKTQNVCFDMKPGFHEHIKKDPDNTIDNILRWILRNKCAFNLQDNKKSHSCTENSSSNINTDFVCWRGLLTRLLAIPYESSDDIKFAVTLYNKTLYMNEITTDKKKENEASRTQKQEEMCYWGWKFEQFISASGRTKTKHSNRQYDMCLPDACPIYETTPGGTPDTDKIVNNEEAFCTVVRSRLNNHSLVYSGEVDAAIDSPLSEENPKAEKKCHHYVEFKTTAEQHHPKQEHTFKRYKLIKWWAQSYLVAIEKVVCGYRDNDGIVHRLEEFDTFKMPEMAKDIRDPWLPNVCFNFLDQILSFIKKKVTVDDSRVVYLVEWKPRDRVTLERLPANSQYCFLPSWFTDELKHESTEKVNTANHKSTEKVNTTQHKSSAAQDLFLPSFCKDDSKPNTEQRTQLHDIQIPSIKPESHTTDSNLMSQ